MNVSINIPDTARLVAAASISINSNGWIVLCHLPGNNATPWATWQAGDVGAFWGHYFDNEADARADYVERASMQAVSR